jgi:integrase
VPRACLTPVSTASTRSATSAWRAQGVDVRTVAEYLGHADPGFTLKPYAHLMPDVADRARIAMGAFLSRAPGVPSVRER